MHSVPQVMTEASITRYPAFDTMARRVSVASCRRAPESREFRQNDQQLRKNGHH
jgi:hypothetical protein